MIFNNLKIIVCSIFILGLPTQQTDFEYKNGDKLLKLLIEKPFIILNKPTKLKLKIKNIDVEKLTITGRNLSSIGHFQTNTQLLFEVLVDKNSIYDGYWEMNIFEKENNKVIWHHTFKIPVKL